MEAYDFHTKKDAVLSLLETVQYAHIDRGHLMSPLQEEGYQLCMADAREDMRVGDEHVVAAEVRYWLGGNRLVEGNGWYNAGNYSNAITCYVWNGLNNTPVGAYQQWVFCAADWDSAYQRYHQAALQLIAALNTIPNP